MMGELLKRVEAASGPDREIDAALNVWSQHGWPVEFREGRAWAYFQMGGQTEPRWHYLFDKGGRDGHFGYPAYTADLNAATGLVEKVSDNWMTVSGYKIVVREDSCDVEMWGGPEISCSRQECWIAERNDRHVALALLAALLKAKIATSGG
jgi:hypothetical protein